MKTITKKDILEFDRIYRLNLINSISGYKAANLIGTSGIDGENLAIISSVIHLGSNPALLGFIMRPDTVDRHTLDNIKVHGYYTINHVSTEMVERAHYTSANFERGVSEFEKCNLPSKIINNFQAPFVAESPIKMAMKLEELVPLEINGTILIIGSIEEIHLDKECIQENGQLDLNQNKTACISGLNAYHEVNEIAQYPYARVGELPDFKD